MNKTKFSNYGLIWKFNGLSIFSHTASQVLTKDSFLVLKIKLALIKQSKARKLQYHPKRLKLKPKRFSIGYSIYNCEQFYNGIYHFKSKNI